MVIFFKMNLNYSFDKVKLFKLSLFITKKKNIAYIYCLIGSIRNY